MGILDLIYPKYCLECGKEGKYICNTCEPVLSKVRTHLHVQQFVYIPLFPYKGVIKKCILEIKFKYISDMASELADMCTKQIKNNINLFPLNPLLLPVPIHKVKQRVRDFNLTELVGKRISGSLGWDYNPNIIIKNTNNKQQSTLDKEERWRNVKGVYSINMHEVSMIQKRNIIVFDDILTTGATLSEAIRVVTPFARSVNGLVICH